MADETAQKSQLSTEQANEALRLVMGQEPSEESVEREENAEDSKPQVTLVEEEPEQTEPEVEEQPAEAAEQPAETEDVESMKARLAEREEAFKNFQSTVAQQIQWSKDGFLRKSNEVESIRRKIRELAKSGEIDPADLERALAGDAQFQQPVQQAPQQPFAAQPQPASEDTITDEFIFRTHNPELWGEKAYNEFAAFVRDPNANITQNDIVPGNTYATMAALYGKFKATRQVEDTTKAKAIKSVQRAQKRAVRAAGAVSAKASPAPPADEAPDFSKMSPEERVQKGFVDQWLKQVMEDR